MTDLSPILSKLPKQKSPMVSAALSYAARGWHVFPVPPGTKKSYKSAEHSGGRKWGATTDADELRKDWTQHPDANVGIVTGPKSGFFVVEADTVEGHGVDGLASLAALEAEHGPLPDTIEAESPSGSRHIYFRWPEGLNVKNSVSKVACGIDVRGDGGMVIAAPSVKPGAEQPYVWKHPPPLFDLTECPDWLLQLCLKPDTTEREEVAGLDPDGSGKWAETALVGETYRVIAASSGSRNDTLNRAAFALGQVVAGGGLDENLVRVRLLGAALAVGLGQTEAESTIESGLRAGLRDPRQPKERDTSERSRRREETTATQKDLRSEFDLSHDALALDMGARSWDRDARHVMLWGKWLFWAGSHWAKDMTCENFRRTRGYLGESARELLAWAEKRAEELQASGDEKGAEKLLGCAKNEARLLRHKSTIAAVESLAQSNAASAVAADIFDANTRLLGTPGGTVDLKTGQVQPAKREDLITRLTSVSPQNGDPKLWLKFLNDAFQGDKEMIAFLQRAAGYSLTGETSEHKLLFCYGGGRNGKGTFLETLFHITSDYSRRIAATALLNSHGEKHPTDLAGLHGARFVVGSELPRGKSWDEAALKDLTGGDVLTARFMRQDFFDFRPQFTLWIAGNTMPSFKGVDEALRARVVLIPFTVTVPPEKRDRLLPEKLRQEAGQILTWAIKGAIEWYKDGLKVPAKVADASREYMDGEDTLGQFLADETLPESLAFVTTTELYQRFSQWCAQQGLAGWTLRTMQKELKSRGQPTAQRKHGNGFLGLRLK